MAHHEAQPIAIESVLELLSEHGLGAILGGRPKTGHAWTGQSRPCGGRETGVVWRLVAVSCKAGVVESLVRQL